MFNEESITTHSTRQGEIATAFPMQVVAHPATGREVGTATVKLSPDTVYEVSPMDETRVGIETLEVPPVGVPEAMGREVDKLARENRGKDAPDAAQTRAARNKMAEEIMLFLRSEAGLLGWVFCLKGGLWATLCGCYYKGLKFGEGSSLLYGPAIGS